MKTSMYHFLKCRKFEKINHNNQAIGKKHSSIFLIFLEYAIIGGNNGLSTNQFIKTSFVCVPVRLPVTGKKKINFVSIAHQIRL